MFVDCKRQMAPGLLLSMPQLEDENFSRSVILMLEHDKNGSFGLVLNRPSEMQLSDVLSQLELHWAADTQDVVWSGGPVSPETGWMLHSPSGNCKPLAKTQEGRINSDESMLVAPGVALSVSIDKLRELGENPPSNYRLLLGYAGWGPGQLAKELVEGSWLHADIDSDLIFSAPSEEMWSLAMRSLGISPETLVQSTGIH